MPALGPSMLVNRHEKICVHAHPPSSITLDAVEIRPGTDLNFGIGVMEGMYDKPGGGVEFSVTVNGKKVYSRKLDPKRSEKDRGFFFDTVLLDGFSGKKAQISFITTAFGKGGNQFCSAGWARPHLSARARKND